MHLVGSVQFTGKTVTIRDFLDFAKYNLFLSKYSTCVLEITVVYKKLSSHNYMLSAFFSLNQNGSRSSDSMPTSSKKHEQNLLGQIED